MEKERQGLFQRLLSFWQGKTEADAEKGIGFWNGAEPEGKPFAEVGKLFSVGREEMKKPFWEETADAVVERRKREEMIFEKQKIAPDVFAQQETGEAVLDRETVVEGEAKKSIWENREETVGKKGRIFSVDLFREDKEKSGSELFFMESPEGPQEKRARIPALADGQQKKEPITEEQVLKQEVIRKKEVQAEPGIDIEKLMRQMTEKLWEEREGCSRRFR